MYQSMMNNHRLRDIAIIIFSTYFCSQSIYIVLKMWTSLNFNDKVNAMETVILTTVVLCEALEILYFYKFDEMKSGMYTGELFGLERRIQYKYGDKAMFRGKTLVRESMERQKRRLKMKNRRFSRKTRSENRGETVENEVYQDPKGLGVTKTSSTEISASNFNKDLKNAQKTSNFVNKSKKINDFLNIKHISTGNYHENIGNSSFSGTEVFNFHGDSLEGRNSDPLGRSENIFDKKDDLIKRNENISEKNEEIFEINGDIFKRNEDFFEGNGDIFKKKLIPKTTSGDKTHYKEFFYRKSVAIIEELMSKNLNYSITGLFLLKGLSGAILLVPLHSFISYMVGAIKFQDLKLALMVYVPFTGSSVPANFGQFIGVSIVQTLYIYLFYLLSADSFMIESLSNCTLKAEIKLFLNNLEEFDAIFCSEKLDDRDASLSARLRKLKILEKLRHIAAHHQIIFRKLATYCELRRMSVIYKNAAICLELCIALFLIQEGGFFFKIKYTVAACCLGLAMALYSQEGQDIEDGFEEMRDALYRISWHNMSASLRKYLVILLTRHSLPPKVTGYYGIFVINRKNLSMIMRASYSYLNLLNQFKRG